MTLTEQIAEHLYRMFSDPLDTGEPDWSVLSARTKDVWRKRAVEIIALMDAYGK